MDPELQSGIRPPALAERGTLGVLGLASCVERAALDAGLNALRNLGWNVRCSPHVLARADGFAGTPEARAAEFTSMWQHKDVDAIVCARGGYGTNYLLPLLDFDALRRVPKAFVGYSDNTSLLLALDRAGIVSFHGPMVASDFSRNIADLNSFRAALTGQPLDFAVPAGQTLQPLVTGEARAAITGGCLSLVAASLGTPWEIATKGKILFLEDVNEKLFRVDRMLMQLLLAGKFRGVRGIIFGTMLGCAPASPDEETMPQLVHRILGGLCVPIALGFPSGHVSGDAKAGNITLPFGMPASLVVSAAGVRLRIEPATVFASPLRPNAQQEFRS